jgi:hypothetical protein
MVGRRGMVGRPVARVGRRVVATAATTAVVVGTAHVVNKAMTPKPAPQQAAPEYIEQAPQEVQYVEAAPVDMTSQLLQLTQLHDAGALTDEEFAAAKAKALAS